MNVSKKQRNSVIVILGVLLTVGAWFSYQPVFYLGKSAGANLEISLFQIAIALYVLGVAGFIIATRRFDTLLQALKPPAKSLPFLLLTLLSLLSTVSLIWTENITRGLLTSGLLWAVTATWVAIQPYMQTLSKASTRLIIKLFLISAIIVALFGWFQIFGDALGLAGTVTLLPEAYRYDMFGFARPTGFSLEPQFFGSILAVVILVSLHLKLTSRATVLSRITMVICATIFFATISRGAYLALLVGTIVLFVGYLMNNRSKKAFLKVGLIVGVFAASIVVSLLLCAVAANINTRDSIDGKTAVIMSINQLSLGVLNIPLPQIPQNTTPLSTPAASSGSEAAVVIAQTPIQPEVPKNSQDSGYVAESTDSRLLMASNAVELWIQSPHTILFGIGAGSFGMSLHNKDASFSTSSIVNNQYIETLTELGIFGFATFTLLLGSLLMFSLFKKYWLAAALITSFSIQWFFFSGNVNVLHIWIVFAIIAFAIQSGIKTINTKL